MSGWVVSEYRARFFMSGRVDEVLCEWMSLRVLIEWMGGILYAFVRVGVYYH